MYKIRVDKKTGFRIVDPSKPVVIRDNRGILFYSTETQTPNVNCFNLPDFGTFLIEQGQIQELKEPIKYPYSKLPSDLFRKCESPFNYDVEFGINPNKCTIDWTGKIILFDSAFLEKPLPEVFFILYHEYGHAFKVPYGTAVKLAARKNMTLQQYHESICDELSGNYMKAKGFNPSQIGMAPWNALSDRQNARKLNMVDSLQSAQ